ncbi:type II secretion system protein GspM [Azomonas macrocytogenes]|uniref:General secretion pathway protein M n=1 Tax=Azomonas macrocytogenes TaxID=69962 RepID=A0A839T2A7_AZOMA|nr:type II secretion system protein GspM [Azomonas macrocytogenes]MBB3103238.1 general secretion pathway protein M [Azomonas macrocytogenes]
MRFQEQLNTALEQSPLWQRWQKLPTRDRQALILLGAVLLALVLYLAVWQPAQRSLIEARSYYQQQRDLHAHIEQNTDLARQMSRIPHPTVAPEQLQGLVTQTAQQRGLIVESLDNGGDGTLTINLPNAAAVTLLSWLAELQRQGIQLDRSNLQRMGDGLVNAGVTLRAAQ